MKCFKNSLATVIVISSLLLCSFVSMADAADATVQKNVLAEKGFVHILGPSPAIVPSEETAFDDWVLESCDIFKDGHTYYWYYHAQSKDKKLWPRHYRIGVATAPTPLGPWKKYRKNPVLDQGPEGSWDHLSVDCVCVMKGTSYRIERGTEKYYMWYSAQGEDKRCIGLATATNPLGPWKKYEGNPILEDFGFLGGVVKVNGKFYMYNQYPVTVNDNGPLCVATAEKPEGPWKKYEGNPIIDRGDWGCWDSGGFSEARVRYHDGVFHWFYGGDRAGKEMIGYAYSFDGFNFTKYGRNPVVTLDGVPDASALAEVHALIEPPFVYLYHTLKYISARSRWNEDSWMYVSRELDWRESWKEDLAVQVLSIDPHFRLSMPILDLHSLGPKKVSSPEDCCPISLQAASSLALTIECNYHGDAKAGLRMHIRSSYDGINYNNIDLYCFDVDFKPGQTINKTIELIPKAEFLKVMVENLDDAQIANSVKVTATLGN